MSEELLDNQFICIKNGEYHTVVNKSEDIDDTETFYQSILDTLNDKQVALVYDDNSEDEDCAYLFYKSGDKLYADYLYAYNELYYFSNEYPCWYTEYHRYLTAGETVELINALKSYIDEKEDCDLVLNLSSRQKRLVEFPPEDQGLTEQQQEKIKNTAKLTKSSLMLVALIAIALTYGLTKSTQWMIFALGATFVAYGIFLLISVLSKARYAYCILQAFKKETMTPNEINWNYFTKQDKFGFAGTYSGLGVVLLVISIVMLLI